MANVPHTTFEAQAPLQGNSQTIVQGTVDVTWPGDIIIEFSTGVHIEWENQTTFLPDTQVFTHIPQVTFLGMEG